MTQKPKSGPVLIELEEDAPAARPAAAAPVPDPAPERAQPPAAMERAAVLAARKPSPLWRWFWRFAGGLFTFVVTLATYDYIAALIARNTVLGYAALVLTVGLLLVLGAVALRELSAFARLRRIDGLARDAKEAAVSGNLAEAKSVTARVLKLYGGRADVAWGKARFEERQGEIFDADGLLALAEREVLAPLDAAAAKEVEAAARQVATVTALVPLALADVFAALAANLRMIRRIAEIYGGRSGTLGSWRVTKAVLAHLVATGAVAVGDDLISSVAGGGVLSKISRRFGEGVVNGALTARVGVAAMEVCRPLPFVAQTRPSVTGTVKRALTGLFGAKS